MLSKREVPHSGPVLSEVLIVGEFPLDDDDYSGVPFSGHVGELLNQMLALAGLDRASCRLANVCNYKPANNNWDFIKNTPQLTEGEAKLNNYLAKYKPKLIIALGDKALKFFGGKYPIGEMRGAPLPTKKGFVLPTFHPSHLIFATGDYPLVANDFLKAAKYLKEPWKEPTRRFVSDLQGMELVQFAQLLCTKPMLNCDFEWVKDTTIMRSAQFAWSAENAIFIKNDSPFGSTFLGPQFSYIVQMILASESKKCFQGGNADVQVLRSNGLFINNWTDDTMVAQHVMEPELPQSLAHLCSVYTHEPYYKSDSQDDFIGYSCKDVIVGYQVHEGQMKDMTPGELNMYRYKMKQTDLAADISFCGLPFNPERNRELKDAVLSKVVVAQNTLAYLVGGPINVASNPQMKQLLYTTWKLPVRKHRGGAITCDEDAIVALMATVKKDIETYKTEAKKEEKARVLLGLKLILEIRQLRKLFEVYLDFKLSPDGRVRSYYKITGTETNRWSAAKYIDNTGLNAQTLPRGGVETDG